MTGCNAPAVAVAPALSATPRPPSSTTPVLPTLTKTWVPIPTHTSYPTFPAYKTKQVLFEYSIQGDHTDFDFLLNTRKTYIALFADGQMILSGEPFREKMLSKGEIDWFLAQLDANGFSSIETSRKYNPSDPLYEFDGKYQQVTDGRFICVTRFSKKAKYICGYEPYSEYFILPMKNLLSFLDNFKLEGATVFRPDRILLDVWYPANEWVESTNPRVIVWPDDLPPITGRGILYFEGDAASRIFELFDSIDSSKIVRVKDRDYSVVLRPVLPHEILIQP
ncbi:MAG: hypothetical protein AB9891_05795 [Anaerolineaceae bacterium]